MFTIIALMYTHCKHIVHCTLYIHCTHVVHTLYSVHTLKNMKTHLATPSVRNSPFITVLVGPEGSLHTQPGFERAGGVVYTHVYHSTVVTCLVHR